MARAIWKGAISFSLIHIPVSLHTATRPNAIDLDLLDKHDFSPVGYQRINKTTGRVVDWKDIVKGYQYEKGEYVVLTEEDFRRANVEATRTIDIQAFVDRDAISAYFFETPYYLAPENQGGKVYGLLREALQRSQKLAVASLVIRSRQYMAALLPVADIIVLNTLRYAEEMLPPPKLQAGKGRRIRTTEKELQMALKLVEEMAEPWRPEEYRDTYRDDLMKRIEQKVKAGQTKTLTLPKGGAEREPARGKVVDLMTLLRKSLDEKQQGAAPAGSSRRRATRRRSSRARAARRA